MAMRPAVARTPQTFKFVVTGKFGFHHRLLRQRPLLQQGRQAVIGLGTENQIHSLGAADDFMSLGLRHTTGNSDGHVATVLLALLFHLAQLADFGVNLVHRLFANVTCIEDHQIGSFCRFYGAIPLRPQQLRHALTVIDIHLAAERLDEDFLRDGLVWCRRDRHGLGASPNRARGEASSKPRRRLPHRDAGNSPVAAQSA